MIVHITATFIVFTTRTPLLNCKFPGFQDVSKTLRGPARQYLITEKNLLLTIQ